VDERENKVRGKLVFGDLKKTAVSGFSNRAHAGQEVGELRRDRPKKKRCIERTVPRKRTPSIFSARRKDVHTRTKSGKRGRERKPCLLRAEKGLTHRWQEALLCGQSTRSLEPLDKPISSHKDREGYREGKKRSIRKSH